MDMRKQQIGPIQYHQTIYETDANINLSLKSVSILSRLFTI